MTAPLFLVDASTVAAAAPGCAVLLDGEAGRHAARVRRLAAGEAIMLGDGVGAGLLCAVAEVRTDSLVCLVRECVHEAEPQPRIVAVQALPKGDRGELAVELMTEVGVDVVVPWAAARCVTQWRDARGDKALARWQTTAREAGKQARRLRLPEVRALATTADVVRLVQEAASGLDAAAALVLHPSSALPIAQAPLPLSGEVVLVVGPEGGITDAELGSLAAAGAIPVRCGHSVLRTSSAGMAAAAVVLSRTPRWG